VDAVGVLHALANARRAIVEERGSVRACLDGEAAL
jgi:hypothetical protein